MCLIAFALNADPACPLLIAANRDEYLDRPTAPLQRWALPDGTEVIGGRDLRDGGSWLGVSPQGRVAMLTNVRQAVAGPGTCSRGDLVTRWLQGDGDEDRFARDIDPAAYGGFNLVVGDFHARRWSWMANRRPDDPHAAHQPPALHRQALGDGVYGLSNASLDTPWPKTLRLKHAVRESLARIRQEDRQEKASMHWTDPLEQVLFDSESAETPGSVERGLSSPFVRVPERAYGTRSSLLVSARPAAAGSWQVDLMEWTHEGGMPAPRGPAHHRVELLWAQSLAAISR